jgi:hypothetical protein
VGEAAPTAGAPDDDRASLPTAKKSTFASVAVPTIAGNALSSFVRFASIALINQRQRFWRGSRSRQEVSAAFVGRRRS